MFFERHHSIRELDFKEASDLRLFRYRAIASVILKELTDWRDRRRRPDVDVICAIHNFAERIARLDVEIAARAVDDVLRDNAPITHQTCCAEP